MKILFTFLLALTIVQALLIPRNIGIREDKLFPTKTLKEWQDLLAKLEYVPSNEPKTKGIPQPESSGKALTPRIVGGVNASEGQFPWQVSIHMDNVYFCGGSLISGNWVLTAGHCVDGIHVFIVYAGTLVLSTGVEYQSTTLKIIHPEYNINPVSNDIALIGLPGSFSIGTATINTVLLPSSNIGSLVGSTARVSGWGKISDDSDLPSVLNYVDISIVSGITCLSFYGAFTDNQICASTSSGGSTCYGDSGAPLVIEPTLNDNWVQVGIFSFGTTNDCQQGNPAGFTRDSSYLSWISSNTGLSL